MCFPVTGILIVLYSVAFHFNAVIVDAGIDVLAPNGHTPPHHRNIMHGLKSPKVKTHYDPYGNDPYSSNFVDSLFSYPEYTGNQDYYNSVTGGSSQWDGGESSATYGTEEVPQSPPPSNEPNPIYIAYYAPHENRRLAHFGVVIHFMSTDKYAEYHFREDGAEARDYQNNGRFKYGGRHIIMLTDNLQNCSRVNINTQNANNGGEPSPIEKMFWTRRRIIGHGDDVDDDDLEKILEKFKLRLQHIKCPLIHFSQVI